MKPHGPTAQGEPTVSAASRCRSWCPSLITMSMLSLIATFNSFDIIWILTRGGPSGDTTTMIIDTYNTAISSKKYGEGRRARRC